jgi:hypothetical protein
MSVAAAFVLRSGDGARLAGVDAVVDRTGRSCAAGPDGVAGRAGLPNAEIGRQVGMTQQTVIAWRARYGTGGLEALAVLPRSGRPPVIDEPAIISSTLNPPPAGLR